MALPLFVSRAPPERLSKLDPDCCSHDDLVAFVRATQERCRDPAWSQLCHLTAHDFGSLLSPRTATITFHRSTEHVRRVPDKPRQHDALAVNLAAEFFLQHTHVGSREALDPSHSILDRTIRLMRVHRTLCHHCPLTPLDLNRVNKCLDGRLVVCLEQHFFSSPRCQDMPVHSRWHKALDCCEAPDKLPPHRGVSVSTPRIVAKFTSVSRPKNP